MSDKKHIRVVGAIFRRGDEILATQRGYGNYKDWWEFPGGKIEPGESPQEALAREIREEMGAAIEVGDYLITSDCEYPEYFVSLECYWCRVTEGELQLLEHEDACWVPMYDLWNLKWLPADDAVLRAIEETYRKEKGK